MYKILFDCMELIIYTNHYCVSLCFSWQTDSTKIYKQIKDIQHYQSDLETKIDPTKIDEQSEARKIGFSDCSWLLLTMFLYYGPIKTPPKNYVFGALF